MSRESIPQILRRVRRVGTPEEVPLATVAGLLDDELGLAYLDQIEHGILILPSLVGDVAQVYARACGYSPGLLLCELMAALPQQWWTVEQLEPPEGTRVLVLFAKGWPCCVAEYVPASPRGPAMWSLTGGLVAYIVDPTCFWRPIGALPAGATP